MLLYIIAGAETVIFRDNKLNLNSISSGKLYNYWLFFFFFFGLVGRFLYPYFFKDEESRFYSI